MNQAWQDAIKQSEEALKGHETEIKDWFELGVEYAYDACLSDIISALSMDKIANTSLSRFKGYIQ